ncbi:MAG: TonB-dependent receptor [Chitinispirillaceae bacterium]|nr:TonB-dependent receptor [Chitinispirillaceae bacterium]
MAFLFLAGTGYARLNGAIDTVPSLPPVAKADSSVEIEPVLVNFVKADYPQPLLKEGIEGTVTMTLLVNERGRVDSIAVVKGIHPELDMSVSKAARQFIFVPAQAGGIPVPVLMTYEYHIRLEDAVQVIEEQVNLSGVVLERGTRNSVPGATVSVFYQDTSFDTSLGMPFSFYLKKIGAFSGQALHGNALVTLTDSAGRFSFSSLPSGMATIVIVAPGCGRFVDRIGIRRGTALEVILRVDRISYSDYEIVVYGKQDKTEVSTRTLTVTEIQKLPGFSGDAIKVIQSMPGVARPTFISGDIIVRGAPTWDSRFYLDGVLIPTLYHYGGLKSTYNSDALGSIQFYPGGFSSRFGGAVAGVIDLAGRNAKRDRFHGYGDINLIDASAMVEGPVGKKCGILATVRRSHAGDLLNWAVQDAGIIDLPVSVAPYYYDFVVRGDADIGRSNRLFCTFFGSRDALELVVPFFRGGSSEVDSLSNRIQESSKFTMAIAGFDSKISGGLENSARIAVNRDSGDASILGFARFGYRGWEYTVRDELRWTLTGRHLLAAGLDLWWMDYRQHSIFPNADNTFQYDTMDSRFGLVAPYVLFEWRPAERLLITPGLRFDYYQELKHDGALLPEFWRYTAFDNRRGISGEPSLRVSARYETAPGQCAKFCIGTYNQSPQPMGFVTHEKLGNPFLPATKARHIIGGYEWRITDLVSADIQAYHNQQWDIPEQTAIDEFLRDPSTPRFSPGGIGRMYGIELLLRHEQGGRFFGWLAYSLSRSERYAGGKGWKVYDRDQPHNLQMVGSCRLPHEWQAGVRLRFVTGNPETPVVGSVYDVTNGYYRPLYGAENSSRAGPFLQTDMRVDKKFVFDKWIISFYLDCQNVFFYLYASPEFAVYNYDYSQKTNISFPFIPSLGVRADF